ncbi:unnamed protein product [Candida parapsilosis]
MSAPCNCKHTETAAPSSLSTILSPQLQKEFQDPQHPANLICELCRLFYDNNWVTGTGGGISIRDVDGPNPNVVYIAPSGVQKERILPWEMFLVELPQEKLLRTPNDIPKELTKNYKYKPSAVLLYL